MTRDDQPGGAEEAPNQTPAPGQDDVSGEEAELEALGEPGTGGVPQPSAADETAEPPSGEEAGTDKR